MEHRTERKVRFSSSENQFKTLQSVKHETSSQISKHLQILSVRISARQAFVTGMSTQSSFWSVFALPSGYNPFGERF